MKKEVKDFEEVIELLDNLCIEWETTNKIHNSLWVRGIAFSIETTVASPFTMRYIDIFQFTKMP